MSKKRIKKWMRPSLVLFVAMIALGSIHILYTPTVNAATTVRIQAEDYNTGGEGVGYHDTTTGNQGAVYRSDNVDIEASSEGGYNVGWTVTGEWLKYNLSVDTTGSYSISLRVGNGDTATKKAHVEIDGINVTGTMTVPATGGYQTYQTVTATGISMSAGSHVAILVIEDGGTAGYTVNWFETSLTNPIRIQAEDYNTGGEGVGYHDTTTGNQGAVYRSDNVDIEACSEGGYNVGWTVTGEWLKYNISVSTTGSYNINLRVGNGETATKKAYVEIDGINVTGTMTVPATGGYQTYQTVTATGISISAGSHVAKLVIEDGGTAGYTVNWLEFANTGVPSFPTWYEIMHEDYTTTPESDATVASFFSQVLGSGKELVPTLSTPSMDWFKSHGYSISLNNNGSTEVLQRRMVYETRYSPGTTAFINQEWNKMKDLYTYYKNTLGLPNKVWWDLMAEWDGSGFWMGVPEHPFYWGNATFPARQDAYTAFKNYYYSLTPLGSILQQTPAQRGTNVFAVTDQGSFSAYPYEWGLDMNTVETATETVNDIQTNISFLRGAARQYGSKPWGVDISFWHFLSSTPSTYDANNKRTGGFSESYLARHMYAAYMNGANVVRHEPVILNKIGSTTDLNPLGTAAKAFADFSLTRHPRTGANGVGNTEVPAALLMPFDNGYDARHWQNQRGAGQDKTWYKTYSFTDGDWMIDNLFNQIYPNYWKHGTNSGAPYTDTASYTTFLANNGDTRPYEPIGNSKWGDAFDIVYNNASQTALNNYKILILSGNLTIDATLRTKLQAFVNAGGTLIANVNQVTSADESLLGVTLTANTATGTASKWLADSTIYTEPAYTYKKVTLTTATKVADNNSNGDAIVTKNIVGLGKVYLTTPYYMQNNSKDQLLNIGSKLIDTEMQANVSATLEGNQTMYIVNKDTNKVDVMLINNAGTTWTGNVVVNKPSTTYTTKEWITDTTASNTVVGSKVKISASVPAYDVRVYAITW